MRERGFLEGELKAKDILAKKQTSDFISISPDITIRVFKYFTKKILLIFNNL